LLEQPGLDLTIRDKSGLSAFAAAMTFRNNVAARKILEVSGLFYNLGMIWGEAQRSRIFLKKIFQRKKI